MIDSHEADSVVGIEMRKAEIAGRVQRVDTESASSF